MFGVALKVTVGSIDSPASTERDRAQQHIDRSHSNAVGTTGIADFCCGFVVLNFKPDVRK